MATVSGFVFYFFMISYLVFLGSTKPESTEDTHEEYSPYPFALSAQYLIYLAQQEEKIYNEVVKFTKKLEQPSELKNKYLKDYEESTLVGTSHLPESMDSLGRATVAMGDPIRAYRIIHRFANKLDTILQNIGIEDLVHNLVHRPTHQDVEDGMEALLRLHYIYGLNLKKFTSGRSEDEHSKGIRIQLTTTQVYEIAIYAMKNGYFTLAKEWLDLTRNKLQEQSESMEINFTVLEKAFQQNALLHDDTLSKPILYPGDLIYTFDDFLGKPDKNDQQQITTVRENMLERLPNAISSDESGMEDNWFLGHFSYVALCNGKNLQSEELKKGLFCLYDGTQSFYYGLINPLKVEILSKDPKLIQIYDVVGDDTISKLKSAAEPLLEKRHLEDTTDRRGDTKITFRTASDIWLTDDDIQEIPISRKLELIMNLNVRGSMASTGLQIASYAYGGHVDLHSDSLDGADGYSGIQRDLKGDRVTTFLIYLTDVEEGGYTAFPGLRTFVKPMKGSAIQFDNILKNGSFDNRVIHGACPLIRGYKWIATKWTHINANFLKRPCGLDPSK